MSEIYLINDRKYKFDILDVNTLDFVKKYYREIDKKDDKIDINNRYSINSSSFIMQFIMVVVFVFILWDYIKERVI